MKEIEYHDLKFWVLEKIELSPDPELNDLYWKLFKEQNKIQLSSLTEEQAETLVKIVPKFNKVMGTNHKVAKKCVLWAIDQALKSNGYAGLIQNIRVDEKQVPPENIIVRI